MRINVTEDVIMLNNGFCIWIFGIVIVINLLITGVILFLENQLFPSLFNSFVGIVFLFFSYGEDEENDLEKNNIIEN